MHRPRRVAASLLMVAAVALGGGACDNDDDEETTPDGSSVEAPDTSARFTNTTADPGVLTPTTGRPQG